MNNVVFRALISLVLCSLISTNTYAKSPKVEWASAEHSTSLIYAKSLFSSNELPDSATELLKRINVSIKDGVVVKKVSRVSYLPTFTEANDDGTEYIYWDEATTDLTLLEASVVLPNGSSIRMSPENIRVRDSDQYNTFTNNKEVVIPLSGVIQGSMIALEYEKRTELSKLESLYSEFIYPVNFQRDTALFEFALAHDSSIDLEWHNNENNVSCRYLDRQLNCQGRDIKKLPYDQSMVWRDEVAAIVVGQKVNWKQVVEHVESAFNKSNYDSEEVRNFALNLTNDIDNLDDKINALLSYASRSIRYVSMSELGHRITPHTFTDVVTNLFGDCKDKSALLVGMLKAIGVDAFPVLVATQRRDPNKLQVASSSYFDHMVVCFDKQRRRYCLDPTNSSTSWHNPASWIQGRVALELREDSEPNTIRLDDYKWILSSKTLMEFDQSANVKESQVRVFSGPYAGEMREGLLKYDDKGREEWLLKNYQDNVSTLTEPTFDVKYLDTQSFSLEIHSNAEFEPYYNHEANLSLIEYDSWIRTELNSGKVDAKHYAVWVDGGQVQSEVVYDFNGLWEVTRMPAALMFNDEIATLLRSSVIEGNKLKVTTELNIKSHLIQPDEVEDYNKMIDVFLKASIIYVEGKLLN